MRNAHTTREGWLVAAMNALDKKFFDGKGYTLPEKRACSCGFPKGAKGRAIGQCWGTETSSDGTANMFICPTLDEPIEVLATLLHELIHAWDNCKNGHKGPFKKLMKEFGLVGKATATTCAPGSDLHKTLASIATELGEYPHKKMTPLTKKSKRPSMGGWVRLYSTNEEDYKVLVSPKMLEENGAPLDPWGDKMKRVDGEEIDDVERDDEDETEDA